MKFRGYGNCSDHVGEAIRVAAVTKPKPPPDQLEDLLRRLLTNVAAPVPVPAPVQVVPTVPIRWRQSPSLLRISWRICSDSC